MTSKYRVIANKDHEVVYTDGEFLGKCNILIFKTESETADDFVRSTRPLAGIHSSKDMSRKAIVEALAEQALITEKLREGKKTYVYTNSLANSKEFILFRKMCSDSFGLTPDVPNSVPTSLTIDDKEDMRELINQGYEVYAFTSYKQYAKTLADYFIAAKEMYGIEKNDEEIYNELVYAKPFERLEEPAKEITEEALNDLARAKEFWEKNEPQIEEILKKRKAEHVSRIKNYRKQQGKTESISSKSS